MKRYISVLIPVLILMGYTVVAENIDPYNVDEKYGWSENTGWLNFDPATADGMQVAGDKVIGWVWGENIGWINLSCENTGYCATIDFGVYNDGSGQLSGYAWGENVGWINFDPVVPGESRMNEYCVRISDEGKLYGWAWGENIGWINFDKSEKWDVRVCRVTLEDLSNFAEDWLRTGFVPAELDGFNGVNMGDFNVFSSYWLDYCPDGWQLK